MPRPFVDMDSTAAYSGPWTGACRTCNNTLKQAARAASLPDGTVAYALRHSAITDLIALHRLDTMTVAQIAGTSLVMIEKNYGHLLREHARAALAGLVL